MSFDRIRNALGRLAQRLGGTRLGVLAIGRLISPLQRELYRRTGGRLSITGGTPVLLLTTTGRRTGKARTVPLFYLRDGDRLVVCNVDPGFEQPNPWIVNLRAEPHASVQIGSDTHWASAAAGATHTVALKTDGTLWAWGHNWSGQLAWYTTAAGHSPP